MSDPDKSFIATMTHPVKVWDVSLCKKKNIVPCSLSQLRKHGLNYLTCYLELSTMEYLLGSKSDVEFLRIAKFYPRFKGSLSKIIKILVELPEKLSS